VPEIVLEPTVDILAALGNAKRAGQVIVGFAAETENVRENAAASWPRKRST
jgi:phosphopantothenoylcysteine decarboxylase/phosphopantothenate--cysteine ligase